MIVISFRNIFCFCFCYLVFILIRDNRIIFTKCSRQCGCWFFSILVFFFFSNCETGIFSCIELCLHCTAGRRAGRQSVILFQIKSVYMLCFVMQNGCWFHLITFSMCNVRCIWCELWTTHTLFSAVLQSTRKQQATSKKNEIVLCMAFIENGYWIPIWTIYLRIYILRAYFPFRVFWVCVCVCVRRSPGTFTTRKCNFYIRFVRNFCSLDCWILGFCWIGVQCEMCISVFHFILILIFSISVFYIFHSAFRTVWTHKQVLTQIPRKSNSKSRLFFFFFLFHHIIK